MSCTLWWLTPEAGGKYPSSSKYIYLRFRFFQFWDTYRDFSVLVQRGARNLFRLAFCCRRSHVMNQKWSSCISYHKVLAFSHKTISYHYQTAHVPFQFGAIMSIPVRWSPLSVPLIILIWFTMLDRLSPETKKYEFHKLLCLKCILYTLIDQRPFGYNVTSWIQESKGLIRTVMVMALFVILKSPRPRLRN